MQREQVLKLLEAKQEMLHTEYGVQSLSLFGSVARNEARTESDIDLLVEFNRPTGYFGLLRLQEYLQELLGNAVDLGTPNSLRPALRARIQKDVVRVA